MKVTKDQYYIINNCLFYIKHSIKSGISAKKMWEWDGDAILNVIGIKKAIRVPRYIINRMISERGTND